MPRVGVLPGENPGTGHLGADGGIAQVEALTEPENDETPAAFATGVLVLVRPKGFEPLTF